MMKRRTKIILEASLKSESSVATEERLCSKRRCLFTEVEAKHFESAVSDESETDSDEIINSNNIECQKPNRDLPQIQTKPQSKTLTNRTSNVGSDLDHVEAKHFESAVSDESETDSDEIINSNNIECQKPNRDLPQIQTKPQSKTLTNRMSNFGSDLDHVDLKNIEPVVLKETGSDETIRSDVLNNNQQTNSNRPQIPTRNQPKRFTNKMCNVGFDSDHIEERKITSDESDQSSLSSIEFDYHSDIYEPDETATSSDYSSSPEKETRKKKTKPSHTQNNKHNGRAEETTETKFERTEKNLTKPGKEIDSHLTCSSPNSSLSNNSSLVVTEYTSGEECVSNVKTTGGESVLGDAEGSAVDSNMDIISVGPTTVQKGRRKQQSCIFCKNLVTNFARHLTRRHKNEPQVLEFLHLSTKSKERKEKIKFLLNSGNFLHNKSVLREKNGTLIVSRRPTLDTENSQYLPCIHCKGFFINHLLYKHQNACTLNTEKRVKNTRSVQSKSRLLLDDNKLWPESFNRDILGTLQPGIVADIIKSDKIICQFGLRLFLSKTEAHKKPYIRNRMRELARLLQVVREKCGKINLEDLIDPTAYSNVIIGVQIVAGYDRVTCQFLHPSTATHLGHSLRQLADIVECNAILVNNKEARKKATDFLRVITTQWQYDVSSVAFKSIQDKKKNKPNIIPTAKDLQKIHKYLVEQEFLLNKELSENHSEDSYRNLCHIMLARVIVFNRRRSGETSRITVEDFSFCGRGTQQKEIVESLSSFEKHLTSVMSRFEICGKRNRNVAVLLTKDMKTSLQLLVNHRQSANVLPENPYLFAIPRTTSSYFRGNDVLRKVAKNSGAENPSVLTSTQLRKHIATISQVLDLQNTELKQLADFMGHNLNVHEKFYRLPENTLQLARISKILISMEKGKMHELKGKTLTEIDRAVESGFREAEVSEKPNDESSYSPDQPNQSSDNDDDNGDIMLGHTQFSSPIKHTKIRKPTRSYAKRKRTNYKPWSDEEKCALAKHMESLILLKKVPNKKQCEEVKKTEPILQRRTWVEIKSYIHNQFKRKDPFT